MRNLTAHPCHWQPECLPHHGPQAGFGYCPSHTRLTAAEPRRASQADHRDCPAGHSVSATAGPLRCTSHSASGTPLFTLRFTGVPRPVASPVALAWTALVGRLRAWAASAAGDRRPGVEWPLVMTWALRYPEHAARPRQWQDSDAIRLAPGNLTVLNTGHWPGVNPHGHVR